MSYGPNFVDLFRRSAVSHLATNLGGPRTYHVDLNLAQVRVIGGAAIELPLGGDLAHAKRRVGGNELPVGRRLRRVPMTRLAAQAPPVVRPPAALLAPFLRGPPAAMSTRMPSISASVRLRTERAPWGGAGRAGESNRSPFTTQFELVLSARLSGKNVYSAGG